MYGALSCGCGNRTRSDTGNIAGNSAARFPVSKVRILRTEVVRSRCNAVELQGRQGVWGQKAAYLPLRDW